MASNYLLPEEGKRNILITSALPYVNNVPHLGNIIGCVLSADVYARFCRLRGHNAIYICGTDEYGTATETKALEEGLTPKQICDKYNAIHREIYEWFDCQFDHFGRTSTEQQTAIAQDIFKKVEANGFIKEDSLEQLFCLACSKFLADRFVEGTCPHCKYDDARGDQCDRCGKLLNPVELEAPRCKTCGKGPEVRSTRHLFLNLPELNDQLREFIDDSSVRGKWTSNSIHVTNGWMKDGLKPRCITRDLKWGTPVPHEGFTDKVFYVWFDAPIGYISITANYTSGNDDWQKWWKNPKDVELYQFMGKDNIPFHTVIFPASLIASNDGYTMLKHISTTEYLNYEDGKFSKSRGTGVFGDNAKDTGIPVEVWRYYLLINRPEQSDSVFTWADFASKNNTELLNNLGNFCQRTLKFVSDRFDRKIPAVVDLNEDDKKFIGVVDGLCKTYVDHMESVKLKDGLKTAMHISSEANGYFQANQPWKVLKEGEEGMKRAGTVIGVCTYVVRLLSHLLEPFMPSFTRKVAGYMNTETPKLGRFQFTADIFDLEGHETQVPQPIFSKITDDQAKEFRVKYGGVQTKKFPLDIKVGKIKSVDLHPEADRLYVAKVDIGKKEVQVCAGLREVYAPEELEGRTVAVLCNLKPSKMKGVMSEGMMLAGSLEKQLGLLTINGDVSPGTPVLAAGTEPQPPAKPLDKKAFDKIVLGAGDKGLGFFDTPEHPLMAGEASLTPDPAKLPNAAGAKIH